MDRRQFLRGLGIFGIGAGASAPALADSKKPKIPKEVLDKLDEGHQHFTLMGQYDKKPQKQYEYNGSTIYMAGMPEYNTTTQVAFKAGPDGNLYIKVNDEWKQVATT